MTSKVHLSPRPAPRARLPQMSQWALPALPQWAARLAPSASPSLPALAAALDAHALRLLPSLGQVPRARREAAYAGAAALSALALLYPAMVAPPPLSFSPCLSPCPCPCDLRPGHCALAFPEAKKPQRPP